MKTRRRKGGKILGEGSFSMAIYPAIPCKDGRDMTKYVSRVSLDKDPDEILSRKNKKLIAKLKKIDPDQKFFIYPEYCTPGKLLEENREDGVTDETKKYSEIMPKAGEDWAPYFRNRTWKEFLSGRKSRIVVSDFKTEKQLNHLKEALKLLHDNKIVHQDLHLGNIIDGPDGLPRIIDFGLALMNPPKIYYTRDNAMLENSLYEAGEMTSFKLSSRGGKTKRYRHHTA